MDELSDIPSRSDRYMLQTSYDVGSNGVCGMVNDEMITESRRIPKENITKIAMLFAPWKRRNVTLW